MTWINRCWFLLLLFIKLPACSGIRVDDHYPPILVSQKGCSGSGWIVYIFKAIIQEIIAPTTDAFKEIFATSERHHKPLLEYFNKAWNKSIEENSVLVVNIKKYGVKNGGNVLVPFSFNEEWKAAGDHLIELGARVIHVYKRNRLDRELCMMSDCFTETFGYAVSSTGERISTSKCFRGRNKYGNETDKIPRLVKITNTSSLIRNLINSCYEGAATASYYESRGFLGPVVTVAVEDLNAYSIDRKMLEYSATHFMTALYGIGFKPSFAAVVNFLNKTAGTRNPPPPQSERIYNYNEFYTQYQTESTKFSRKPSSSRKCAINPMDLIRE